MRQIFRLVSASLAALWLVNPAFAQQSTETYTYDALGRLTKVDVTGGSSDGEHRNYDFDAAGNRTQVGNIGGAPCPLGPVGFTTTASGFAFPRVYAPTAQGCGEQIQLAYTVNVISGNYGNTTIVFSQFDDTLEADEHAKVLVINPDETVISAGNPLIFEVVWQVVAGNAVVNAPGVSLVTVNPD